MKNRSYFARGVATTMLLCFPCFALAAASATPASNTFKAPTYHEVYFDDFNGSKLSDDWEILGGDPSVVSLLGGQLWLSSNRLFIKRDYLDFPGIRLKKRFPDNVDWRVTIKYVLIPSTFFEQLSLVLYNQFDTHLGASYFFMEESSRIGLTKVVQDQRTPAAKSSMPLYSDGEAVDLTKSYSYPVYLQFGKQGDIFYVRGKRENWPDYYEWSNPPRLTFPFSSQDSRLAIGFTQSTQTDRRSTVKIDWLKIETTDDIVFDSETALDKNAMDKKVLLRQQELTDKAKEAIETPVKNDPEKTEPTSAPPVKRTP